jgi:hypothetical protein
MIKWFVLHQWKQETRSSIWQKNVALNIVIGFFMLIMLMYLLALGVFLEKILESVAKNVPAEISIAKIFIYYALFSFLARFFLQSLPAMEIVPYLHLRIKRSSIGWFMLFKSLTSFFNFMPIFLFLPFALDYMTDVFGGFQAFVWFASIFFFELTINFKLIYFKRKFTLNPKFIFLLLVGIAALIVADNYAVFSISTISLWYFGQLQNQWLWVLLPVFTTVVFVFYNLRQIRQNSYLDDLIPKKSEQETLSQKLNLLQNFGKTGELVLNEIRLIFRNKRAKTTMAMLPLFLLYGLFFYPNKEMNNNVFMLVFVGIFVTGSFMIAYGQYLMAWESSHFDFVLSSNIGISDYFKAKYFLLLTPTLLLYIFTIPYAFFGMKIFWINFVSLLYNVGINIPFLLYAASYNKKRMELGSGSMMNYQGLGLNNFIISLPLLLIPAMLYMLFKAISGEIAAIVLLGVLGILGLAFNQSLIRTAIKHFEKNRYALAQGYRQKG